MFYRTNVCSFLLLQLVAGIMWLSSCNTIDLYEKVVPIPKHQWQKSFKPEFTFTIKDTTASYKLYFVIRHHNKYNYNNIWVKLQAKGPVDTLQTFRLELPLANKEGWMGSGMDDIFGHWIEVHKQMDAFGSFKLLPDGNFQFTRAGAYTFTLEQIMRDDALTEVMNVGVRIEKKIP